MKRAKCGENDFFWQFDATLFQCAGDFRTGCPSFCDQSIEKPLFSGGVEDFVVTETLRNGYIYSVLGE